MPANGGERPFGILAEHRHIVPALDIRAGDVTADADDLSRLLNLPGFDRSRLEVADVEAFARKPLHDRPGNGVVRVFACGGDSFQSRGVEQRGGDDALRAAVWTEEQDFA